MNLSRACIYYSRPFNKIDGLPLWITRALIARPERLINYRNRGGRGGGELIYFDNLTNLYYADNFALKHGVLNCVIINKGKYIRVILSFSRFCPLAFHIESADRERMSSINNYVSKCKYVNSSSSAAIKSREAHSIAFADFVSIRPPRHDASF